MRKGVRQNFTQLSQFKKMPEYLRTQASEELDDNGVKGVGAGRHSRPWPMRLLVELRQQCIRGGKSGGVRAAGIKQAGRQGVDAPRVQRWRARFAQINHGVEQGFNPFHRAAGGGER